MIEPADLRAIRALRHLSQADLAAKAGMTQTAIAEFEKAKRELRTDTVRKLCEALNVTVTYTVDGVSFQRDYRGQA